MKLPRIFFQQKTLQVARQLLGCFIIRQIGHKKITARIIETEAYCGSKDLANHASKGRTKRTEVMFGPAGHAYIYLIYGMYYCFNIVTGKVDYPAAVLVRGIEIDGKRIIGPGKVCRELKIDKKLNGVDITKSKKLYITQPSNRVGDVHRQLGSGSCWPCQQPLMTLGPSSTRIIKGHRQQVKKLPRVGVDYAGEYKDKLWRFVLE